jgi:hypothetical protein
MFRHQAALASRLRHLIVARTIAGVTSLLKFGHDDALQSN